MRHCRLRSRLTFIELCQSSSLQIRFRFVFIFVVFFFWLVLLARLFTLTHVHYGRGRHLAIKTSPLKIQLTRSEFRPIDTFRFFSLQSLQFRRISNLNYVIWWYILHGKRRFVLTALVAYEYYYFVQSVLFSAMTLSFAYQSKCKSWNVISITVFFFCFRTLFMGMGFLCSACCLCSACEI